MFGMMDRLNRELTGAVRENLRIIILINLGFLTLLALAALLSLFCGRAGGTAVRAALAYAVCVYAARTAAALVRHTGGNAAQRSGGNSRSLLRAAAVLRRPDVSGFSGGTEAGAALTGFVLFCLCLAVFFLMRFALPFFLFSGGPAGLSAAAFCLWLAAAVLAGLQFFPILRARTGLCIPAALKRCAALCAAHPFASFASLFFIILLSLPLITFPSLPLLFLDRLLLCLQEREFGLYSSKVGRADD